MKKLSYKAGTVLGPLPAVMVSCGTKEKDHNIITIAWTGIVNSEPPMTYVSIRKSRHSHKIIKDSGEFVINIPNENLAFATDYCGVKSGRDLDKFKEQKLTKGKCKFLKTPLIVETPVNLECKVTEIIELPSHDMFLAEIINVNINENLVNEKGKFMLEDAKIICYNHGEYFGVKKKPLGRFGYSVMKPKTRRRINREKNQRKNSR